MRDEAGHHDDVDLAATRVEAGREIAALAPGAVARATGTRRVPATRALARTEICG